MIQPLVLRASGFLSENTKGKNFSPRRVTAPMFTKNVYDLTIIIIKKCLEFLNYSIKIIRIRYECKQFCPIPVCLKNKKKNRTALEVLERYVPKSNQHQIISRSY